MLREEVGKNEKFREEIKSFIYEKKKKQIEIAVFILEFSFFPYVLIRRQDHAVHRLGCKRFFPLESALP